MNTTNRSIQDGRKLRMLRMLRFAVLAVLILAAAAYLWGNRLNAASMQVETQRSSATSASRYSNSLGISAVRAVEATTSRMSSLSGVSAVRAIDQATDASSSPRVGAGTQGLSNLELQRAKSQTHD